MGPVLEPWSLCHFELIVARIRPRVVARYFLQSSKGQCCSICVGILKNPYSLRLKIISPDRIFGSGGFAVWVCAGAPVKDLHSRYLSSLCHQRSRVRQLRRESVGAERQLPRHAAFSSAVRACCWCCLEIWSPSTLRCLHRLQGNFLIDGICRL